MVDDVEDEGGMGCRHLCAAPMRPIMLSMSFMNRLSREPPRAISSSPPLRQGRTMGVRFF